MKIELDLNDILGDEFGAETLQESIKRQVIEQVRQITTKQVAVRIEEETAIVISTEIRKVLADKMPKLMDDLLDYEYVPIDRYGVKDKGPTTFRLQLIKTLQEQMVYKQCHYDSDKNEYTKMIDKVIGSQLEAYKAEFLKMIDEKFKQEALEFAISTLAKKLGLVINK